MRKNLPWFIARRYLLARKSHNAINVISAISVCGVALAAMAMVCTMSVFNGFKAMVEGFFTEFDPQVKVLPSKGITMQADNAVWAALDSLPCVECRTAVMEQNALADMNGKQLMVTVKGVDANFSEVTHVESLLYGDGEFILKADVLDFGVPGIQLAAALGNGADYDGTMKIYAPKKGERVNMANPASGFNVGELYSAGVVFAVKQAKYDASYIITSIDFAQRLFDMKGKVTAMEIKLAEGYDTDKAVEEISALLGDGFTVLDRYAQQKDVFRIMEIEKWIAYLFLAFILLVACFNIIGCVSMLIVEKKDDVGTLRALGASDRQIVRIFLFEGRLIALAGAILGVAAGLLLCWMQQEYGLLKLGSSSGEFIIDAYPVRVELYDVLMIMATVTVVGCGAIWFPVRMMANKLLD